MNSIFIKQNQLVNNKALSKAYLLSNHLTNAIDARIANKNPTTSKPIFSTIDHSNSVYIRNTNCWCYDIDLTGVSVWNSTEGGKMAGTLISPRHIIMSAHYQINTGSTLRFVTNNNTVITRTLSNKLTHPDYFPIYPDITIGLLDSDLPSSIKPIKIFSTSDFVAKTGPIQNANGPISKRFPALCMDFEKRAIVKDWVGKGQVFIPGNPIYSASLFFSPTNPTRLSFDENIVFGDSGSPSFFIMNKELALITLWTTSNNGTWTSDHIDAINTMMNTLGGGYQITPLNIDNFSSI